MEGKKERNIDMQMAHLEELENYCTNFMKLFDNGKEKIKVKFVYAYFMLRNLINDLSSSVI